MRKPAFGLSYQVRLKPASSATVASMSCSHMAKTGVLINRLINKIKVLLYHMQ